MMAIGVLIYGGVGCRRPAAGRQLPRLLRARPRPRAGQHRGIFWVEVGVAITVCGVMLKIFYMFADRGKVDE
jgi:multicomponent Na+:H+ antiporter subunit B